MNKFKKMRLVVDHTNDETSERFCYKALNYADDLAVLLAGKRKRAAETCRMAKKVNDEMSKRMDTGVRPNPLLMRIHGKTTSRADDQPSGSLCRPNKNKCFQLVPLTRMPLKANVHFFPLFNPAPLISMPSACPSEPTREPSPLP